MYIFNNDPRAARLLKEYRSTGESSVKSVLNALMENVKQIARLRNLIEKHGLLDIDISIDLIDAMSAINDLKAKGMNLNEIANETDIFSKNQELIPDDKLALYQAIATLTNNSAAYKFISGYYAEAYDTINPDQMTIDSKDISDKQQYLLDYAKRWLAYVEQKEQDRQAGKAGKKVGTSRQGIRTTPAENTPGKTQESQTKAEPAALEKPKPAEPRAAKDEVKIRAILKKAIDMFGGVFSVTGDKARDLRKALLEAISGMKVPYSKAGVTNYENAIYNFYESIYGKISADTTYGKQEHIVTGKQIGRAHV